MGDTKHNRFPEPTEAKRFLERKLNVKTEAWDELKWGEHSHAFTVAHSVGANVLDDIHGLINKAMAHGESLETFKAGMLEAMAKTGWYGKAGKTAEDESYINWRIKVIYETNMRTAYSASRYREQLAGARTRPIWVYLSKMHGKNRRPEHILLHNKAFRYDDPFWDAHYPPNGWGCQCRVTTKSEHGAERDGIEVLKSDSNGNPPMISGVDWDAFDPTWKYNVGREALAPNFEKYKNLPENVVKEVYAKYRKDMDGASLPEAVFKTLAKRTNEADYKPTGANYQIGNMDTKLFDVVKKLGVSDSKIMTTDGDLYHATGHKKKRLKETEAKMKAQIDRLKTQKEIREKTESMRKELERLKSQVLTWEGINEMWSVLESPPEVYRDKVTNVKGKAIVLHYVKRINNEKAFRVVLRSRMNNQGSLTAHQLVTTATVDVQEYKGARYEKVW